MPATTDETGHETGQASTTASAAASSMAPATAAAAVTAAAAATAIDGLVGRVDYPLYVVTAADGDEASGCLAGFVTQCSIQPPRLLVCISKQNHTYRVAERATSLAVHLLGQDQRDLASLFGEQSGDVADKLGQVRWAVGTTGAPVLADCAAWVEGRVLWRVSAGDHEAFLMTTDAGGSGSHPGQLTLRTAGTLRPGHPATDAATVDTATGAGPGPGPGPGPDNR
ncbi:MAG TPA: flavin reductase family protein [Acidimicrobiales bacterium]|nr:flavin reductase family protein [Acidimicrobiales bacterium]